MHYVLQYEKVADHAEREAPLHEAHTAHVLAAARRGELILAGSLADPEDGAALLVFDAPSVDVPTAFAVADPYVVAGVVNHWRVRAWATVVHGERKPG